MKQSPNASTPRNSNTNHPPLARNAQGHPIAMPDGAASWSIKRETRGRPKVITGPDGHPYRLALTATEQDVADAFGAGTYRLDALDALGNVLDYVTTIEVTGDESDDDQDDEDDGSSTTSGVRDANTDLRFALHTIMQMSRAQSESLRAVSEAQADWVKGLANARALPRNAVYLAPSALPEPDELEDESEDESDDDGERNAAPIAAPAPPWMAAFQAAIGPAVDVLMSKVMPRNAAAAPPTQAPQPESHAAASQASPPPPPAMPNPMVHLAKINAGLSDAERHVLADALRGRDAETLTAELLRLSVDDAITIVSARIAELRVERAHARARAAHARDPATRDATGEETATPETGPTEPAMPMASEVPAPTAEATAQDFMRHVLAVATFLDSDRRVAVLSLIPRLPPDRVEQLKATLLAMPAEAAAAWIRANLASLIAEVAS